MCIRDRSRTDPRPECKPLLVRGPSSTIHLSQRLGSLHFPPYQGPPASRVTSGTKGAQADNGTVLAPRLV
eukprot:14337507-Alexandrium_andersonii.AAC.1